MAKFTIRQVRDCPTCKNHAQHLGNWWQWKTHMRQYKLKNNSWQHLTIAGKAMHKKLTQSV